jgi:hypothetical protein
MLVFWFLQIIQTAKELVKMSKSNYSGRDACGNCGKVNGLTKMKCDHCGTEACTACLNAHGLTCKICKKGKVFRNPD